MESIRFEIVKAKNFELFNSAPHFLVMVVFVSCSLSMTQKVKSLMSEAIPSATQFFMRAYKINHGDQMLSQNSERGGIR